MATPKEFDPEKTWHLEQSQEPQTPTPGKTSGETTPPTVAPNPPVPIPVLNADATMTIQAVVKEAVDPLGIEGGTEEELPGFEHVASLDEFFDQADKAELTQTERTLINNAKMSVRLRIELKFDKLPRRYRLTIARLMIKEGKGNRIQNVPDEIRARFSN